MRTIPGGFRSPTKQRRRAWWTLAICTLALAFPATAMAASAGSGHRDTLLALGSGDKTRGGSPLVRALQRELDSAGYPSGKIDGRFGPRTQQALIAFQAAHGLKPNGHVGSQTLAMLSANIVVLGPGAGAQPGGSNLVRALQRRLMSAGDSPGPIDGQYGPRTERAVRRFQRAFSLPANGIAGTQTLALLAQPAGPEINVGAPRAPRAPEPGSPARTVRSAARHRRGSGTVPWTTILGGLALALALILAGPLLIVAVRRAPRHDDDSASAVTAASGMPTSSLTTPTLVGTTNGHSKDVNRTNKTQAHTNGQDGATDVAAADDDAEGVRVLSDPLADSEEAVGAFNLGLLLEAQGSFVEAQAAYGRADDRGHSAAASNLGRLLEEQGALFDAEAAYRRADQRGDPDGAFNLGVLLEERAHLDEAAAAYRRAIERGNDAAASNLGVLLEERGALAEAEAAYRRADDHGDAIASFNLGVLLEERGALLDAEEAYLRAEGRGERDIANMARAALLDLGGEGLRAGADRTPQQQNA
ncbi:MAG: peptidoglycan-binding protein [Solirubrobacteraceae bacterium]